MLDHVKNSAKNQPLVTPQEKSRVTNALEGLLGNRGYALTEDSMRALVALLRSVLSLNANKVEQPHFVELIKRTSASGAPSLTQGWKADAQAPPTPVVWRDAVTGLPLKNPFLDPPDRAGQAVLLERDPALAEHFQLSAANPYLLAAKQADEAAHRAEVAAMTYGPEDHKGNPWRSNDPASAKLQAIFAANQPPLATKVFKEEAAPISLPWSSASTDRTASGRIMKSLGDQPVPGISGGADLIELAGLYDNSIRQTERVAAENDASAASARARALAAKPVPTFT